MPDSPQSIEDKLNRIAKAWKLHAEKATFAKMTLEQFAAAIKPSYDERKRVADLEIQLADAINKRDESDVKSLAAAEQIVKAVVGDVDFGDDSSLYEAMGYVRTSDRKSGLTRKKAGGDSKPAAPGK
ncbi:MAG: hypothetical protein ACOYMN_09575 [Roseimicrobium sp.]